MEFSVKVPPRFLTAVFPHPFLAQECATQTNTQTAKPHGEVHACRILGHTHTRTAKQAPPSRRPPCGGPCRGTLAHTHTPCDRHSRQPPAVARGECKHALLTHVLASILWMSTYKPEPRNVQDRNSTPTQYGRTRPQPNTGACTAQVHKHGQWTNSFR